MTFGFLKCVRCHRMQLALAHDTCAWCWRQEALQSRIGLEAVSERVDLMIAALGKINPAVPSDLYRLKVAIDEAIRLLPC